MARTTAGARSVSMCRPLQGIWGLPCCRPVMVRRVGHVEAGEPRPAAAGTKDIHTGDGPADNLPPTGALRERSCPSAQPCGHSASPNHRGATAAQVTLTMISPEYIVLSFGHMILMRAPTCCRVQEEKGGKKAQHTSRAKRSKTPIRGACGAAPRECILP